jgi:hypothetical protein
METPDPFPAIVEIWVNYSKELVLNLENSGWLTAILSQSEILGNGHTLSPVTRKPNLLITPQILLTLAHAAKAIGCE